MDIEKSKVVSLILMNMLESELGKIIEDEIDKGDNGNYAVIDLLIELSDELYLACETL